MNSLPEIEAAIMQLSEGEIRDLSTQPKNISMMPGTGKLKQMQNLVDWIS